MLTVAQKAPAKAKTFPIIEIFGPTIQGEGAEAGLPTHFVRLGGCDYRCSWCDTMYAVDPAVVRRDAMRMGVEEICAALDRLAGAPAWVSLSGGNPALHHLGELVDALHAAGRLVSVETQGSVWRDWLAQVDRLTVSPKPPSSGMATAAPREAVRAVHGPAHGLGGAVDRAVLKIVCFDEPDLAWAKATASAYPRIPLLLSAGTPIPADGPVRELVGDRYRWLCERVAADPELATVRVLPQLHVIAWKEATRRMSEIRMLDARDEPRLEGRHARSERRPRSSRSSRSRRPTGSRTCPPTTSATACTATASASRSTSAARSTRAPAGSSTSRRSRQRSSRSTTNSTTTT